MYRCRELASIRQVGSEKQDTESANKSMDNEEIEAKLLDLHGIFLSPKSLEQATLVLLENLIVATSLKSTLTTAKMNKYGALTNSKKYLATAREDIRAKLRGSEIYKHKKMLEFLDSQHKADRG